MSKSETESELIDQTQSNKLQIDLQAKTTVVTTDKKEISTTKEQVQIGEDNLDLQEESNDLPYKKINLTQNEAIALAKAQPGLSNIVLLCQIMSISAFIAAFIGYVKTHNLIKNLDAITYKQDVMTDSVVNKLNELTGAFAQFGAIGGACWFFVSALAGGLSLIVPIAIYNKIAHSRLESKNAFVTMYDLVKAEILKFMLMALLLGVSFKFLTLKASVVMATFVLMLCLEIIFKSVSLGKQRSV